MKSYIVAAVVVVIAAHIPQRLLVFSASYVNQSLHNFEHDTATLVAHHGSVSLWCGGAVVHRVENIPRNLMCSHETLSESSLVGCGFLWMLVNRTLHSHRHHHQMHVTILYIHSHPIEGTGNENYSTHTPTQHTPIFVFILRTCGCVDVMVAFLLHVSPSLVAECSLLIDHWWQRYLYGDVCLFFPFFTFLRAF